jgi:NhaP-type Na+/H+ or K+/H+ antiporter
MHENMNILFISLVILGYGFVSKLITRFNISGPMVFATIGVVLSPLGFNLIELNIDAKTVTVIAELALIIVLFSDASSLPLNKLKYEWGIAFRLLFIGLPITIIMTTYFANIFFPNEMFTYLLLMALILAPTDAALGKAVVTDTSVPEKVRSSINVESGLNDGIVYPILLTVVAMIVSGQEHSQDNAWIAYVFEQIVLGALSGSIVGYLSAMLARYSIKRKWMLEEYENLIPIALAILAYYLAESIGGNGFISAFFAGLLVGNYSQELKEHVESFAESEGDLLIMISFLVFGLVFIPATYEFWNIKTFMFAVLSLTLFRMIPVSLSLLGTRFDFQTHLFIAWFGPRGIASILYVLVIVDKIGSIKAHESVFAVITMTIMLSIILHGLSAQPFARLYSKKEHKNV